MTTVFSLYGTKLDRPTRNRWERWRPSLSLCQQEDLVVDRYVLVEPYPGAADVLVADIRVVSPHTQVERIVAQLNDPWDFEEVYERLLELVLATSFDEDDLLVHITTGTHVAQICLFLLTEARFLPGRLVQTSPPSQRGGLPRYSVVDLDLARYDRIAQRFAEEREEGADLLKQGIHTLNAPFNRLIDELGRVAVASRAPILLTGPTGAGKSQLARRLFALKQRRQGLRGRLVELNCATLRGDQAMSTLFGHRRGAFTGAVADRDGLLLAADGGVLFLDEIGELGLDEQAMLLRAIEDRRFLPVGDERERSSDFQLLAGTNRDLRDDVREGRFREDLLARLDLWSFTLPALRDRPEDIAPNLDFELDRFARQTDRRVSMSREARDHFLAFARSPGALWRGNFRDLGAAVTRMATLCEAGRISEADVELEMVRLQQRWGSSQAPDRVRTVLGERADALDRFDRVQLDDVLAVCARCRTLSDVGRELFAVSRTQRSSVNDSDRIRKYLARFDLTLDDVHARLREMNR